MKLYYAPGTCALSCWIALKWAGADFEPVKADFTSDDFKRVNPLGAVPALDIGSGRALAQAGAILNYIADLYPDAKLGPTNDINNRFTFNETMFFLTGDFHPAFWPFFFAQRYTTDTSKSALDQVREASYARIDRVMDHLDGLIGDTEHVYDNRRTVADAYAFVMARWTSKMPKSWKDYPNVSRLFASLNDDADVQEVLRLSGS